MRTIGVLVADRMGHLSQSFCLQKMRELKFGATIVVSKYFSGSVRSDYKVADTDSLRKTLDRFADDDLVICSSLSKAYSAMAAKGTPKPGRAYEFSQHLQAIERRMSEEVLDRVAKGGNFSFTVRDLRGVTRITQASDNQVKNRLILPDNTDYTQCGSNDDTLALTVVFLTHNRTAVACHCLEALCKNLKYDGRIHYCICDDRSEPGHVEALEKVLSDTGVTDYAVKRTTRGRWGLGASMNNGLNDAFTISPIVLTAEDDFLLVKPFDITEYTRLLIDSDVAGIRLAHLRTRQLNGRTISEKRPSAYQGFFKVVAGNTRVLSFVFNNQVMLRHRRVYDKLGLYAENVSADVMENGMARRYNSMFKGGTSGACEVLYPDNLATDTLSNGLFTHIGNSTQGHSYTSPREYAHLNTRMADKKVREAAKAAENTENTENTDNRMSVTYVCDAGALAQAAVSSYSVLKTHEAINEKIYIDIVCHKACADAAERVVEALGRRFWQNCAKTTVISEGLESKCAEANKATDAKRIAMATGTALAKFELPNIINLGKTLFLDCDTIVVRDITGLFSTPMDGKGVIAVSDVGFVTGRTDFRGKREYFNSGVMLMDLNWMRRAGASEALWKAKRLCGDQTLVDQNAFNMVMEGHVKLADPAYNSLVGEYCEIIERMNPATMLSRMNTLYGTRMASVLGRAGSFASCARVFHFAGKKKPWNTKSAGPMTWCLDEWRQVFDDAVRELPGATAILKGVGYGI